MFFDQGVSDGQLSRRAFIGSGGNGELDMQRTPDGSLTGRESADNVGFATANDDCYVLQWVDGDGRSAWVNKVSKSLTVSNANTAAYNSSSPINIYADTFGGASGFFDGTAHALAFITSTLTTTQRETITDLINEL